MTDELRNYLKDLSYVLHRHPDDIDADDYRRRGTPWIVTASGLKILRPSLSRLRAEHS